MASRYRRRLESGLGEGAGYGNVIGANKNPYIAFLRKYHLPPGKSSGEAWKLYKEQGIEPEMRPAPKNKRKYTKTTMYEMEEDGTKNKRVFDRAGEKALRKLERLRGAVEVGDEEEIADTVDELEQMIEEIPTEEEEVADVIDEALQMAEGHGLLGGALIGGARKRRKAASNLNPYIEYLREHHTVVGYESPYADETYEERRTRENRRARKRRARGRGLIEGGAYTRKTTRPLSVWQQAIREFGGVEEAQKHYDKATKSIIY